MAHSTLALLRSALGRFLGRWHFTYQRSSPGAVDRADDVSALFGQVMLEYPSGSPPNSRLASPSTFALVAQSMRLCSRWSLTHWRYPQRSRPVVSPAVPFTTLSWPSGCLARTSSAGWPFVSLKPLFSVRNVSNIPGSPELTRKHKIR